MLSAPPPELTIVIPTLNEQDNIVVLVQRLDTVLTGVRWEAMFVDDDSADATHDRVRELAATDARVRLLHRIGRRGLSSACIEGALASTSPYLAVMDADLQHDETLLPAMLARLQADEADLVIGSRYVPGGSIGEWTAGRAGISGFATRLARLVTGTPVHDPMSGFFMLRRPVLDRCVRRLSAVGFKILLDILASSPRGLRVIELPFVFRVRHAGSSKLDAVAALDYLVLLADKLVGQVVPVRFLLFAAIGALGLVLHVLVLALALRAMPFPPAQWLATLCAMAGNFLLNDRVTFRDRRLRGPRRWTGLCAFTLLCGLGAAANVGVANLLVGPGQDAWWLAGIAGAAMSLVWNYAVSSTLIWRR
jgi:dolichol-phosphate mannosyltransferase